MAGTLEQLTRIVPQSQLHSNLWCSVRPVNLSKLQQWPREYFSKPGLNLLFAEPAIIITLLRVSSGIPLNTGFHRAANLLFSGAFILKNSLKKTKAVSLPTLPRKNFRNSLPTSTLFFCSILPIEHWFSPS